MSTAPDRLLELKEQTEVTGIDFVYIYPNQTLMDIHFLSPPDLLDDNIVDMAGSVNPLTDRSKIRIYNPSGDVPDKKLNSLTWELVDSSYVLRLTVASPGDFTLYKIFIDDPRVDPFYNNVTFDFKANCPSDLDCKPPAHECPVEDWVDFPVDYLARDFWSYRQALLEFASIRYPHWPDRLEADAGNMLLEVMAALGDEMAYYQDRIGREAHLETATQRRSLRRHARLIDYTFHDGLGASARLVVFVDAGDSGVIPAGTQIAANGDSGLKIVFETDISYSVDAELNALDPHIWDEDKACLPIGSKELFIDGHYEYISGSAVGKLKFDDPVLEPTGKWVLFQTKPLNPSLPIRPHFVRLIKIKNTLDPVFTKPITHLVWEEEQATPFELDMTQLKVHTNVISASAGKFHEYWFFTEGNYQILSDLEKAALAQINNLQWAVERTGPNGSLTYLFTLPGTEEQHLVRKGKDPFKSQPEIWLDEMEFDGTAWIPKESWKFAVSFVGQNSVGPDEKYFTLDDGAWRRVVGYQRSGTEIIHSDYASNNGLTIRFGNGKFGFIPDSNSVFRVRYRLGNGRWDNVGPDSLQHIDAIAGLTLRVTNPLAAENGVDPQSPEELKQLAPEAFRAVTYRAVTTDDYAEAAKRLHWVQRAGAAFRWTGSWLSAFVTPDPKGATILQEEREDELLNQLNRFRQAGREVNVMTPVYANMDLEIEVCVSQNAYPGEVKERVIQVLLGKKGIFPVSGYFSADNFTFGTPLRRPTLEAVIQAIPGVKAVEGISFRRRGWFDWTPFREFEYDPGQSSIIRVENDLLHPERGSLKIYTHGGA